MDKTSATILYTMVKHKIIYLNFPLYNRCLFSFAEKSFPGNYQFQAKFKDYMNILNPYVWIDQRNIAPNKHTLHKAD